MNCNQSSWYDANKDFKDWYYANYPFLKDFSFPIEFNDLKDFYFLDMENRNLTPLQEFSSCYEFLFSYFLENYPRQKDPTRFKGKTWFERTLSNIPDVVKDSSPFKFFESVGNLTDGLAELTKLASRFWFFTIPVGIYLFLKKK